MWEIYEVCFSSTLLQYLKLFLLLRARRTSWNDFVFIFVSNLLWQILRLICILNYNRTFNEENQWSLVVIRCELMCQSNVSETGRLPGSSHSCVWQWKSLYSRELIHHQRLRLFTSISLSTSLGGNYFHLPIIIGKSRQQEKKTWKQTHYWSRMRSVWDWVKRSGYIHQWLRAMAREKRKKRFKFEARRLTPKRSFPFVLFCSIGERASEWVREELYWNNLNTDRAQ